MKLVTNTWTLSWYLICFFPKSVSSEDSVPVFELSRTSTVSSDNGVYPLRNSEGDLLDDDSLEDGENDAHTTADEAVFAEPRVRKIALHYKCAQSKGQD